MAAQRTCCRRACARRGSCCSMKLALLWMSPTNWVSRGPPRALSSLRTPKPLVAGAWVGVGDRSPAADELQAVLRSPRVVLFDEVGSTLDVAHELGEQGTARVEPT